jgi:hypothetical protein
VSHKIVKRPHHPQFCQWHTHTCGCCNIQSSQPPKRHQPPQGLHHCPQPSRHQRLLQPGGLPRKGNGCMCTRRHRWPAMQHCSTAPRVLAAPCSPVDAHTQLLRTHPCTELHSLPQGKPHQHRCCCCRKSALCAGTATNTQTHVLAQREAVVVLCGCQHEHDCEKQSETAHSTCPPSKTSHPAAGSCAATNTCVMLGPTHTPCSHASCRQVCSCTQPTCCCAGIRSVRMCA